MRNRILVTAIALLATGLSACKGNGSMTTAATFDLQAGFAYLLAHGQVSSVILGGDALVSGVSTSFTGSGTLTLAPSVATTFNGTAGVSQTEVISGTVTTAGQSANYASSVTDYYSSGAPTFLGESANGEYDVAQTPFNYPTMIDGGSTGILGTLDRYTDSTMGVSLGTIQVSYSVLPPTDPISTVQQRLVEVTETVYDIQNIAVETDIINYTLSSTGTMIFDGAIVQNATGNLSVTAF
jgi:hypothetical protein